ncbi:MAG: GNAT family N-acetyltransferase [Candidatus Cyclonatronum sp.]|uniref:GNAT family N-acetyltransferase n=1 Tax=Cyclonatronum sp. TaxID=3024185 RepID=UPI0025B7FA4C|nr:GNAT family N-acetyltransferase [Cyclonatronum sp.]MCC5935236.1 GNAT family N-acetyltransferase [Balneolales bacterium]MCH8487867.1 GNAT family N-acetyltransferase [Cyclonatronum sp.]
MYTIEHKTIQTAARVLAGSFAGDPGTAGTLEGLPSEKKTKLLNRHAVLHIRYAAKQGLLHLLDDDPRAFMIGGESSAESLYAELKLKLKIVLISLPVLGFRDFFRLIQNTRKLAAANDLSWYKGLVPKRHYRLKIIAVDPSLRGTGAFRRLITPALEHADKHGLPVVLETHNPANVGLYEHFGFELVKTLGSPGLALEQFCMVRKAVDG